MLDEYKFKKCSLLKNHSCFSSITAMTMASEAWIDSPLLPGQHRQRLILQIKIT